MNIWLKSTAAAAALSVAMASGAAAQDDTQENQAEDNGAVLQDIVTTTHDEFGDYLTDGRMMALYMFTADEQGTGDSEPVTNCTSEGCLEAWPPLTIEGEPQVGPAVEPDMVGEFERPDGTMQITYNGWPLYYYAQDTEPGDIEGQDVEGGGGEWYLLNPQGEPIKDE